MTESAEDVDAWQTRAADPTRGGPHFGRLIEAVRALQDTIAETALPDEEALRAAERLEQVTAGLRPYAVGEPGRVAGRRPDLPGRLYDGDRLVSDANGLFVELRPGQP